MQHLLSRRRWITVSSAAALGAGIFDVPAVLRAAGLDDPSDPYGGFPMGVQSYSLRQFNTVETVRHVQGLGLHYVEFYAKHLDPQATDEQIRKTQSLLEGADITISAHGVSKFSKDHEANRKIFQFAQRAGIRNLSSDPHPDSFDSLEKLVAEFDVRIAIHNHGPGARYDSIESVAKAIRGRHKHIGACVDTGHFIRSGEDPVRAVRELKGRVFGVHVKDDKHQRDKRSHNVVIGQGHLDVVGLFQALRKTKFPADGGLSLEYESNPNNPIDDMAQCLAVARDAIGKVS